MKVLMTLLTVLILSTPKVMAQYGDFGNRSISNWGGSPSINLSPPSSAGFGNYQQKIDAYMPPQSSGQLFMPTFQSPTLALPSINTQSQSYSPPISNFQPQTYSQPELFPYTQPVPTYGNSSNSTMTLAQYIISAWQRRHKRKQTIANSQALSEALSNALVQAARSARSAHTKFLDSALSTADYSIEGKYKYLNAVDMPYETARKQLVSQIGNNNGADTALQNFDDAHQASLNRYEQEFNEAFYNHKER